MKNILLTGATGFLGSALLHQWVKSGYSVSILTRPTSSMTRIVDVLPSIQVFSCSNDDDIFAAVVLSAPDVIVHTACSYGRSGESAFQVFETNTRFGMVLLQAAIGQEKKVSFINTGTILAADVSNYAMSKRQFSVWGQSLSLQYPDGLQFVDVALQHMYGPGDDASKFTTHVIRSCGSNVPELALTLGEQRRDFIYIDDVVSAYDTILINLDHIDVTEKIEVGSGLAPTVRYFVEVVQEIAQSSTLLNFGAISYRASEAMHCQADLHRMQSLGWKPRVSLQAGIKKILEKEAFR